MKIRRFSMLTTCHPPRFLNALKRSIFTPPPYPTNWANFDKKTKRKVCNPFFMEVQTFPRFYRKILLIYKDFRPVHAFLRVISQTNPHPSTFLRLSENSHRDILRHPEVGGCRSFNFALLHKFNPFKFVAFPVYTMNDERSCRQKQQKLYKMSRLLRF